MIVSPYARLNPKLWEKKTRQLVSSHPLRSAEIAEVVKGCWAAIFKSRIGGFRIGTEISPKPQIMGFLLHELIPLEFKTRYPGVWAGESASSDKDLVYLPDPDQSVELKTSSHKNQIFGNRSYAQLGKSGKKSKSGFYLAVNFESFKGRTARPKITRIRFGWLDNEDWIGQKAQTGQQAHIAPTSERSKLLTLYDLSQDIA